MASSTQPAVQTLTFPQHNRAVLEPYLPPSTSSADTLPDRPFITLTYATSLDSQIAARPGVPTALSGPASKAMTHYLRTRHDAILVGAGTAAADDPTLNSRLDNAVVGAGALALQPRPVVLDPRARWDVRATSSVVRAARDKRGRAPWVVVGADALEGMLRERKAAVEGCGGRFLTCAPGAGLPEVMMLLAESGITSVMVEGGGQVIDALLSEHIDMVDSVVVTIAPVYLGQGGVVVSPKQGAPNAQRPVVKFQDVTWMSLDDDVVMCARIPIDKT